MEAKIATLMKKWGCTREEALSLIEEDKKIDKMQKISEIQSDLSEEQKKNAKKARITTSGKKTERKVERKPNELKRSIIKTLADALAEYNPTVSNIEKMIDFKVDGVSYSVSLTAHRNK